MAERSLHIGIDARELAGQPTGVGRYLAGLIREWASDPAVPHRFTLFFPGPAPDWLRDLGRQWSLVVEPASAAGTWWEQVRVPRAAARAAVEVWFSPGYTAPLRLACPFVVAIHDVSFFARPEWFEWRERTRRRWLTRASARRAKSVITISEFSAQEIVRWLGVRRENIRLAPPGVTLPAAQDQGSPRQPIVLFVGSLFNRRRIPEMLQGFAAAAARVPAARLILVGHNRTHPHVDPIVLAERLGIAQQVEWRAYVSDGELERLYASARVFLFLSEYEGFAMTPLEALAHGAPPVLLDTAVSREVYEGAGLFTKGTEVGRVNALPTSVPLDDALVELLTNDTTHARLVAAGRDVLSRHSWSRAAAEVRRALEQAAAAP